MKPMLSASLDGVDLDSLRFPKLLSPKLDGIRCLLINSMAYSRNMKPIRSQYVQEWAARHKLDGLDGELIVGSPTDPMCLHQTQSGVMSFEGTPDFRFYLFDMAGAMQPFHRRLYEAERVFEQIPKIVVVPHHPVETAKDILTFEDSYLQDGYEGVMLRDPNGPYKPGRATLREEWLLKLKRFTDGEAVVTGLEEGRTNLNELTRDELGRAKRSTHQENLVGNGMVGTIIVNDTKWGELRVAPGVMTHAQRKTFWDYKSMLIGCTIHWRSFGYGVKDKPRFPRYYGLVEDR